MITFYQFLKSEKTSFHNFRKFKILTSSVLSNYLSLLTLLSCGTRCNPKQQLDCIALRWLSLQTGTQLRVTDTLTLCFKERHTSFFPSQRCSVSPEPKTLLQKRTRTDPQYPPCKGRRFFSFISAFVPPALHICNFAVNFFNSLRQLKFSRS